MRLGTVLTPISEENLLLAAQCSVTDLVVRYPGEDPAQLTRWQQQAERHGLAVTVVEGYLPIENLKLGVDDGTELKSMKSLLTRMGDSGINLLCYNFMSGTDWVRTSVTAPERGGALVSQFRLADVERAVSLNTGATPRGELVTPEALWNHLDRFLNELLPVAERAGVVMCMHPDDPPLPQLLGRGRIMHNVENFERLVRDWQSPSNRICFCQGAFASMGVDIPETIRRLGSAIRYVHCRDVRGGPDDFTETFHDNGPTDMFAAMRAYAEIGFDGPMRPDHVPMYVGETGEPGYTMLGRLFAYGYLRGLIQAATNPSS